MKGVQPVISLSTQWEIHVESLWPETSYVREPPTPPLCLQQQLTQSQASLLLMYIPNSTWEGSNRPIFHETIPNINGKSKMATQQQRRSLPLFPVCWLWHHVLPDSVLVITTKSLMVGQHPTSTSHHNGSWGQVTLLLSLAWKCDRIPHEKDKPSAAAYTALFHYHFVGRKHFSPGVSS